MEDLFTIRYHLPWALALGAALFFPVRQLIWVLAVRREENKNGPSDEEKRKRLKNRSSFTSALLCLIFAYFYMGQLLSSGAGK